MGGDQEAEAEADEVDDEAEVEREVLKDEEEKDFGGAEEVVARTLLLVMVAVGW